MCVYISSSLICFCAPATHMILLKHANEQTEKRAREQEKKKKLQKGNQQNMKKALGIRIYGEKSLAMISLHSKLIMGHITFFFV